MKTRISRRIALASGLCTLAAVAAGCGERGRFVALPGGGGHRFAGYAMGSTYTVKIASPGVSQDRLQAAQQAVATVLADVVAQMSHYEADSELARLNRQPLGTPMAASAATLQVFATAQAVHAASAGAFDITLGQAVDAWGFGPSEHPRRVLPTAAVLALRQQASPRAITLDRHAGTLTRRSPVLANLSGIAKGYGVDRAAQALDALGIGDYMVEVGGEIRTRGHNGQAQPWQLAVELPDALPQRAMYVLPLSGLALATSGDYRNFFMHEGRRYSHEIDPDTAAPVHHTLAAVSVVAADCTTADAWSTALFVAGPERGLRMAQEQGLAAYFVVRQAGGVFAEHSTPAFARLGGRSVA